MLKAKIWGNDGVRGGWLGKLCNPGNNSCYSDVIVVTVKYLVVVKWKNKTSASFLNLY